MASPLAKGPLTAIEAIIRLVRGDYDGFLYQCTDAESFTARRDNGLWSRKWSASRSSRTLDRR